MRKIKNWKITKANPKWVEGKKRAKLMRERRMALRKKATLAEKRLRGMLYSLRILHIFQKAFCIKGRLFIVDFFLPKEKLVIEVDGAHHRADLGQSTYDDYRTNLLETKRSLNVVRFTNQDVLYRPEQVREELKSLVKAPPEG